MPKQGSAKSTHTIGVIGVRDYRGSVFKNSPYLIKVFLNDLAKNCMSMRDIDIVTGGGRGVEDIIVNWAQSNNIPVCKIPPRIRDSNADEAFQERLKTMSPELAMQERAAHLNGVFQERNAHIVAQSTRLVFFWDGYVPTIPSALALAMHLQKQAVVYPLSN